MKTIIVDIEIGLGYSHSGWCGTDDAIELEVSDEIAAALQALMDAKRASTEEAVELTMEVIEDAMSADILNWNPFTMRLWIVAQMQKPSIGAWKHMIVLKNRWNHFSTKTLRTVCMNRKRMRIMTPKMVMNRIVLRPAEKTTSLGCAVIPMTLILWQNA